jgi:hypothetical protein
MSVILAIWDADLGRIMLADNQRDSILKITSIKWAEDVAQ